MSRPEVSGVMCVPEQMLYSPEEHSFFSTNFLHVESESILLSTHIDIATVIGFKVMIGTLARPTEQALSRDRLFPDCGGVGRASSLRGREDCFFALARFGDKAWFPDLQCRDLFTAHKIARDARINLNDMEAFYIETVASTSHTYTYADSGWNRCPRPAVYHLLHQGMARVTNRLSWQHGYRPSPTGWSRRVLPISSLAYDDHRAFGDGGTPHNMRDMIAEPNVLARRQRRK
jgi:hypothetical protein